MKILVVDDEAMIREVIKEYCAANHFTTDEAASGKEALKKLPQREHDLIEAKFFHDKKLRELSDDFNISPSRISRIIQSGLNKIRKELEKNNLV